MSGVTLRDEMRVEGLDEKLVEQLVEQARAGGLQLTGENGVLQQLTKRLLESTLEGEIPIISGTRSTTRRGATAETPATGTGRWC